MEERTVATRFLEKKTSFLFSCWSCSRRLRGEIGRAEDSFLPSSGRKKLAEAGPPGKRSAEVEAKNRLFIIEKTFYSDRKKS
jgi:hypothetical protein